MMTRMRLSNPLDPHQVRMLLSATMVVLAAGCTAEGFGPDVTVDGTAVRVIDNDFQPADLQVTAGDTVTWTWEGARDHNVVGDAFQSQIQSSGTFTHTFDEPGVHPYACTLHSGMRAEIVVTD